jgi:hypothetical protein
VGTLSSELTPLASQSARPRIYADANIPAGLVAFMRQRLRWDVFFVMEHADLRRARDSAHYRLARQLGRTLLTLDRDYFDDRRFPLEESGGVIVLAAPDERALGRVLRRIDRVVFRDWYALAAGGAVEPPLQGRKLHAHLDWP